MPLCPQLENGEPKPITQIIPKHSEESPSLPQYSFEPAAVSAQLKTNAETNNMQPKEKAVVSTQEKEISGMKNWPGRYTLLTNKASLDAAIAARLAETNGSNSTIP